MPSRPLRALIVDDTVLYRKILSEVLAEIPDIEVAGTAPNGKIALSKIEALKPDIITLDFEMPEMDGLETLQHLRQDYPHIIVIMVSAHTKEGAEVTIKALELGAFTFITKPENEFPTQSKDFLLSQLQAAIKSIDVKNRGILGNRITPPQGLAYHAVSGQARPFPAAAGQIKLVAIGISTGGPNALAEVIPKIPGKFKAPIVIVQHLPPKFTNALAASLNQKSKITVIEGEDNMELQAATAYIAPGGKQMKILKKNNGFFLEVNNDPPEKHCQPSADYLFRSVAKTYGNAALGVIMTGMGNDGTLGLRLMKRAGAQIIAQDQKSCVVFGMPAEAINAGVTDAIVPLSQMASEIIRRVNP